MDNEPTQRCQNCLKSFPQSKIATHFGYCRRNIKKCPICQDMYDINFKEEHDEEFHKQQTCPHCKRSFPSIEYKRHESNCTQKPKYCQYCDLNVPVATFPTHLKQCEARTKPCTKCNRPITNKQYIIHIVSCQGVKEEPIRTYQDHIQQQRRLMELNQPTVVNSNSRDKIKVPSYQPRRDERQVPPTNGERQYAPINVERPRAQEPPLYNRNQPRQEEKKQIPKYPSNRVQPKREEIKRPNLPPSTVIYNGIKKQEVRLPGKISVPIQNQPSSHGLSEQHRRVVGSRQIPKPQVVYPQQVSNKEIYPPQTNYSKGPSLKESKSMQRPYNMPVRKEEERNNNIPVRREEKLPSNASNGSSNPNRILAPEPKTKVIYNSQYSQPPITPQGGYNDYLQEEYALGALGQDSEMQMAILQSLGQGPKATHNFENEWSNPSFLENQRVIEEELKKKKRG